MIELAINVISTFISEMSISATKNVIKKYRDGINANKKIFNKLYGTFNNEVYHHLKVIDFVDIYFRKEILDKLFEFEELCNKEENAFSNPELESLKNLLVCKLKTFLSDTGEFSVFERDYVIYPKNDYFNGGIFEEYIKNLESDRDELVETYDKFVRRCKKKLKV